MKQKLNKASPVKNSLMNLLLTQYIYCGFTKIEAHDNSFISKSLNIN